MGMGSHAFKHRVLGTKEDSIFSFDIYVVVL